MLLWMAMIWSAFSSSTWKALINGLCPFSYFMAVNHLWGTLISRSAMFLFDGTNTTSTVNSYSSTSFFRVFSRLLICTRVLPVRVSDTQWCTHTVCFHDSTLHCHWRAKLMPFNTASSSARLIWWASFSGSQPTGIPQALFRVSPMLLRSLRSWHQPICSIAVHLHTNLHGFGSSRRTESTVSDIIRCSKLFLVSSSQQLCDRACPPLEYSTNHTEPTTYRENAQQASRLKRTLPIAWQYWEHLEPCFLTSTTIYRVPLQLPTPNTHVPIFQLFLGPYTQVQI